MRILRNTDAEWFRILHVSAIRHSANLPNRYSALCWRPVTHAQTWASYSARYRFGRLSRHSAIWWEQVFSLTEYTEHGRVNSTSTDRLVILMPMAFTIICDNDLIPLPFIQKTTIWSERIFFIGCYLGIFTNFIFYVPLYLYVCLHSEDNNLIRKKFLHRMLFRDIY